MPVAPTFDRDRLWLALALALVVSCLLLAFALRVSLIFADLTGSNHHAYWVLCSLYFVLGPIIALAAVPWNSIRVRLLVIGPLALVAVIWGATR